MSEYDPSAVAIGSELFRRICDALNSLTRASDARWGFDAMSGAFKFSDEVPNFQSEEYESIMLPSISVLRSLWGYRISLVSGEPRPELEAWWTETKRLAPNWPGFLPARCSAEMLPIAETCEKKADQFSKDMDALSDRIEGRTSQPRGGNSGSSSAES